MDRNDDDDDGDDGDDGDDDDDDDDGDDGDDDDDDDDDGDDGDDGDDDDDDDDGDDDDVDGGSDGDGDGDDGDVDGNAGDNDNNFDVSGCGERLNEGASHCQSCRVTAKISIAPRFVLGSWKHLTMLHINDWYWVFLFHVGIGLNCHSFTKVDQLGSARGHGLQILDSKWRTKL